MVIFKYVSIPEYDSNSKNAKPPLGLEALLTVRWRTEQGWTFEKWRETSSCQHTTSQEWSNMPMKQINRGTLSTGCCRTVSVATLLCFIETDLSVVPDAGFWRGSWTVLGLSAGHTGPTAQFWNGVRVSCIFLHMFANFLARIFRHFKSARMLWSCRRWRDSR